MKQEIQMSETLLLGSLLAIAGGFLDAYTYIIKGGVFANAQTGNMVLMGIYLAKRDWMPAFRYLIPILAFVGGVIIAELIREKFKDNEKIHWRQIMVAIEAFVLVGVAFLPQGRFDLTSNVLVSFVCSMQVQSFRKINGSTYATTMCTGNLRSATEEICNYHRNKDKGTLKKSLAYFGIIIFFIVGAILGCILCQIWKEYSVLVAAGILVLVLLLMFYRKNEMPDK